MTEQDAPPTFVSQGWYRVRGLGWAAVVNCDRERDRDNTGLIGMLVHIDGEPFIVKAVERHPIGLPIRKGEMIGLLVKEKG